MKSPLPHRVFVGVMLGGVLATATVPASGAAGHAATSRVTTATSTRTLVGPLATSPHSHVVFGLRQRDIGHSGRSMSLLRREHGKWSSLPGRVVVRRNNEFVGPKLFDLAPLSASDVWLIGESTTTGIEAIFHYNGVRFRTVTFPPLGSIKPIDVTLFGIVARSRNDATVTGSAFDSSTRRAVPMLFHFDGARWARVQNNGLSDYYSLGDVTAARNGRGIWTIASGNSGYSLLHINGAHVSGFPVPRTVRLLQSIAAGGGRVWAIGVRTNVTNGEGSFPADRSYVVFWHGGKVRVVTPTSREAFACPRWRHGSFRLERGSRRMGRLPRVGAGEAGRLPVVRRLLEVDERPSHGAGVDLRLGGSTAARSSDRGWLHIEEI